jgi:hypothetical protein
LLIRAGLSIFAFGRDILVGWQNWSTAARVLMLNVNFFYCSGWVIGRRLGPRLVLWFRRDGLVFLGPFILLFYFSYFAQVLGE